MPRRTKDDWVEALSWIFTRFSAWLCIPVAFVAFIGINVGLAVLASINPIFKGLQSIGPIFGPLFGLIVLIVGLKAGTAKLKRRNLYDRQTSLDSIRDLSWSQFEQLIDKAYR